MIRVFKPTDRDFTSNGDAVIVPIKARVKNNVNGEFTLELTAESRFYDYLTQGNIIIAPTPQGEQAFRINNQVQRKGDRITVKARHVFYDCENLVIADSYAVDLTCEQALNHFNAATDSTSPFTMHSDITDLNTFRCVRKSLGEAIGTVIERWGGYLVRDNWDISVNKSIGRDLGVTIRYAKNLNELTASYDFSGVATKILPVGKDGILLPESYVYSDVQYSTPYTKAVTINQDINEDDYTTEEEYQAAVIADLRTQAQTLVNKTCYPAITYSLKGKPEKVQDIGDVIQVIDERIGVNITTQVIGYEWDIITESYANLTFGNFGNTLSGLMAKVNSNTKGIVQESVGEVKTEVKNSIDKIYDLLQGSYVVYRGYDILLLDTIPIGAATHVIKFSKDGILISNNGVDGTFTKVYDITTQRLSVPSISLNGTDLGATLNRKLEAADLVAGRNVTITRDGRKQIINAASGSLKYFKETNKSLYGEQDLSTPRFVCDPDYYFDYAVTEHIGNDQPYCLVVKDNDLPCIACASDFLTNGGDMPFTPTTVGQTYTGAIIFISTNADATKHSIYDGNGNLLFNAGYYRGNVASYIEGDYLVYKNYAYEFTFNDATWYASCFVYARGSNWMAHTHDGHILYNMFAAEAPATMAQAVNKIMNGVNIAVNRTAYSGLSRTTNLAFFAGATNVNGTDAPIKIYGDGTYEGIGDDKQDKLTAGENIHIAPDGTISATDTTYSAFTGTDGQTAGAAGLVPAPTVNDANKYLKGDGTWAAGGGGGSSVIANPSGTPTDTLQTVEIDGTIYEIEGGAGGGGELTEVDLWTNTNGAGVGTYTLSNSIDDYDFLAIYYGVYSEYTSGILISDYRLVSVKDLNQLHTDGKRLLITGWNNRTVYLDFNQTTMVISVVENGNTVLRVRGIKINGGASYTETSLWSGNDTATMTLTDSFENYDAIKVIGTAVSGGVNYRLTNTWLTSTLSSHINDGIRFGLTGDAWYVYFDITNNTTLNRRDQHIAFISEIVGIKFGGGSDVEANPQDTPTDTLETIKIGDTVYDIAGNAGGGGIDSLADYTWTEILSTNGASGALPSNYNKLLYIAYYAGTVQVYKVIDVAEMKKAMAETSATKYSLSWTWNDNHGNYDTSYFYFDGTNISISSGYSGVGCKLYGANISASGNSELITFGAGDGTTSRTFQLTRTPRKITMAYFEGNDDNGWASQYILIWGVARAFGTGTGSPANTGGEAKTVGITYGADNKSFTVNASNVGSAMNTTSGHGYLWVEY